MADAKRKDRSSPSPARKGEGQPAAGNVAASAKIVAVQDDLVQIEARKDANGEPAVDRKSVV